MPVRSALVVVYFLVFVHPHIAPVPTLHRGILLSTGNERRGVGEVSDNFRRVPAGKALLVPLLRASLTKDES
jgi:hypothetical protein